MMIVALMTGMMPVQALAEEDITSDSLGVDPSITVGTGSSCPGETIDIPVSIANNSGIVSLNVSISYDSSKLKLTGVTNGTVLSDPAHSGSLSTNPYKLCYAMDLSPTNITNNGVIATLTFEILPTASPGDTDITVDYNPNEIYDIDYNNIFFEKVNGKITVVETETPSITVGTAFGKPGETVDVPVSIADNSGIVSLNVSIAYDNTKLRLTGVSNGTVLTDPAHSGSLDTNPYKLCFAMDLSPTNVTENGVIATLHFEILATATQGDTAISVDYNPNEIYDINYNNVYFEKVNGKITVLDAGAFYQSFLDGNVKIWAGAGVVPDGAVFNVKRVMPPPTAVTERTNEQLPGSTIIDYHEIALALDSNFITQLSGNLTIASKLPVGYESGTGVNIYQEDASGTHVKMTSWVEDGYVYYETDWLETY